MAADLRDAASEAARLALRMASAAVDTGTFLMELGEELPLIQPVLATLNAIRTTTENVKHNREDLGALQDRFRYITACVVVKCRRDSLSSMDVSPLEACIAEAEKFANRCRRRSLLWRVLKASSDKSELAGLNTRLDRLTGDLGLAGIAILEGKADDMKRMLESLLNNQEMMMSALPRSPVKLADVPKGAPIHKSWHVERRNVMETVFETLTGDGRPHFVGLVGGSGAGKTTAASECVRSTEVREAFSDGIVWLTVSHGAEGRLSSLMLQLALSVYEDVGGRVGHRPVESDDGAAYVKQRMEEGRGGKGLKCLVVADDVSERGVVSKLLETGMRILLTTRHDELVVEAGGETVGVDELSEADAESVLRRAAELPPDARLPDDAVDLIELCGRVAMDLAFVGRWSTVRGRRDRMAWSDAAGKVRAEIDQVEGYQPSDSAEKARTNRRKAVLQSGFEDLATGVDDKRVQQLYLSLAMLPDGHGFTVKDAAVLLYDRTPCADDETSVAEVVGVLERWSVLRSADTVRAVGVPGVHWTPVGSTTWTFYMHSAHSSFAREGLMDRKNVRRAAQDRWVKFISSLDALQRFHRGTLKDLWLAVEDVGGDGWAKSRPYASSLARMEDSNPLLWDSMKYLAMFQQEQDDWDGAIATCRRIVQTGMAKDSREHMQVAILLKSLGCDFLYAKQLEAAEELLRPCLKLMKSVLGPEHVQVTATQFQVGVLLRQAGRLKDAEELLARCLEIDERKLGRHDVRVADTLHQLGVCVRDAGQPQRAKDLLKRCLVIQEAGLGREHVNVASTSHELGLCV